MMYNKKLVACVKVDRKVLREFKDTVYLPYNQEYSILIKNLETVRALAHITIDGQDVCDGGLVIQPNSEVDLERFVRDQNRGNRFKFIERTAGIEQHRGIRADDGIVRVAFQFEQRPAVQLTPSWGDYHYRKYWDNMPQWPTGTYGVSNITHDTSDSTPLKAAKGILRGTTVNMAGSAQNSATPGMIQSCASENGITVPGSVSDQKFTTAAWFPVETEQHVIVLKLLGETEDNRAVRQPVTVKAKPRCQTCGRQNRATARFCTECGTSLEIFA